MQEEKIDEELYSDFMLKKRYSIELCNKLLRIANDPNLKIRPRLTRYEAGDKIHIKIRGIMAPAEGRATLAIEKYIGGGFAGQVYRCRLEFLKLLSENEIEGLEGGKAYAVKIHIPPSSLPRRFRNLIYWLAYQGPFSAQTNENACHSGLILQKLIRRAAKIKFGSEKAVKDVFAFFYDLNLGAYGEISEWIEGRMWQLESDRELKGRNNWKNIPLTEVASPEYIAKRRFMADMVDLAKDMGAAELARQYEWWTMKSQTNSLYRQDCSYSDNPSQNICAIDFRSGLALLPFFPLSPVDIKLIFRGLVGGNWVQFDRYDTRKARLFFEKNSEHFFDLDPAIQKFFKLNEAYRRSLPDITHHGLRIIYDSDLRKDIRSGLADGYYFSNLADKYFLEKLKNEKSAIIFGGFYLLGALPIIGTIIRKFWGNLAYRNHIFKIFTDVYYLKISFRSRAASALVDWHRAGRVDEKHVEFLLKLPFLFIIERFTLGFLPPIIHSLALRPINIWHYFGDWLLFLKNFMQSFDFREKWLLAEIESGKVDGLISRKEAEELGGIVKDSSVARYLKYLGVHFSSILVTRIFSVVAGFIWATWLLFNGYSVSEALAAFGLAIIFFQVIPISPGSIFRGSFVIYLMIKERNYRGYLIAAPVSFIKYIGYFAFPLQMTSDYPQLARFMASRWAIKITHYIPIFGERGALLEHWVFDVFFNYPQKFIGRLFHLKKNARENIS